MAVKLGHTSSAPWPMSPRRLDRAGADALVLFNRFYQPDFDLEKLEVVPNLTLSRGPPSCRCGCAGSRSCRPRPAPTSR